MTRNELNRSIEAMEKELTVRETAAAHLSGIPKIQNQTAIDILYDRLCNANLKAFENASACTGHVPETSLQIPVS